MFVDYPNIKFKDNPLDKIWDEQVFEWIIDYLRRNPCMRLDTLKALFEIEYREVSPDREKSFERNYGIGGELGYEEVTVKACKPAVAEA